MTWQLFMPRNGRPFILALIAVVLLAGLWGEAEAGKKKNKKDDDDNTVSESLCPRGVFGDYADASGRWVTYQTADPVQVCDRTTGKFWEQSPSTETFTLNPDTATQHCADLGPGWRLPEVQELNDVVDYSTTDPAVNTSVFPTVQSDFYWSVTSFATDSTEVWIVFFLFGGVVALETTDPHPVWCVRSGS